MNEIERKQLYNFLLMPICCDKKSKNITIVENKIFSGQKYYSNPDADMSDIAIEFYEIIYRDLLQGYNILKDKGQLLNKDFAGDTINSFNSIRNITIISNQSAKFIDKILWPQYLLDYYNSYHCLANFWLLPMQIGRKSAKLNRFDSVDLYLNKLSNSYCEFETNFADYFKKINSIEKFIKTHFIDIPRSPLEVLNDYKTHLSEILITQITRNIQSRAEKISKSVYAEELYTLFFGSNLINIKRLT